MSEKTITVRVDEKLHKKLKMKLLAADYTITDFITETITKYLNGEINLKEDEN